MFFIDILQGILAAISYLYLHYTVYTVMGLFATRTFPATEKRFSYAVLIAARNEEAVIGKLLESIRRQDYDGEITVFAVADNCSDDTAAVARAGGAICYERFDTAHCTKGFALQYLVEQIRRDHGIDRFDGYFIFDADNLLRPDYISRMNEAFAAGEKIVTSYRGTKNFGDNWISASYGLHWLRTIRREHRGRSLFRLATRVQGTGFLFHHEVLRDGWNYTSLTEDRAFCADLAAKGYQITYNHAAVFYDEQPIDLQTALRQRIRWSKGHLQAFFESGRALFRQIFKRSSVRRRFICFDMLTVLFPRTLFSLLGMILLALEAVLCKAPIFTFKNLSALLSPFLGQTLSAAYLFIAERARIAPVKWYKKIWFCVTFPLFDLLGSISFVIALFTRVEWKPIRHQKAVGIDEIK